MQSRPEDYVGDSDSSLIFYADEVKKVYPASPLVIIERNPEEVKASLGKQFGMDVEKTVDLCQIKLEEIKDRYEHLNILFNDLANEETIETLWNYCLSTIPFDVMRWKMLDKFKVELTEQEINKTRRLLCRGQ
ncbi:MAG: hypothetical protein NUW09_03375 [Deltaproteobacteria bacterium]|nr:hypothetical protein [Deltaproteobacteria bacterium]